MNDTPSTDLLLIVHDIDPKPGTIIEHARQLERELNAANARIARITDGFRREQNDIEQTCGKALGYPRFCDDQKNFPGSTEADGVIIGDHVAESIAAELANKYAAAMERVKRLEEALVFISEYWNRDNNERAMEDACWHAVETAVAALTN